MKTIVKAVKTFNRKHNPFNTAVLDDLESHSGHYRIAIRDDWGWYNWYVFSTVKEFIEWEKGVVFENEL